MKKIELLILLFLFISCATTRKTHFLKEQNDSLSRESFSRAEKVKIDSYAKRSPLFAAYRNCFNGDFQKGLKKMQSLIENYKDDASYWNKVGACYYMKGKLNRALIYYQHALDKSKGKMASIYNNIGLVFLKKELFDDARKMFNKTLKKKSNSLVAHFNLAQMYIKFGLLDDALKHLRVIERKNNKDPEVLSAFGVIYYLKGKNRLALRYFNKLPASYAKRSDIGPYYSLALEKSGKKEQARSIASAVGSDIEIMSEFNQRLKQIILE